MILKKDTEPRVTLYTSFDTGLWDNAVVRCDNLDTNQPCAHLPNSCKTLDPGMNLFDFPSIKLLFHVTKVNCFCVTLAKIE